MAYCSADDVRAITNLTSSEITDAQINDLISQATYDLNSDIGATLTITLGDYSATIGNIDGDNKTYTLRTAPIGDFDNDGSVGTTDMEMWSKLASEDHWTKQTNWLSSIDDHEMGKITLSSAPDSEHNYLIKYVWFPIPYNSPLIKKACMELTSYMCFLKTNLKDVSSYRIGKVSVSQTSRHPDLVNFYQRYTQTLGKIRSRTIFRTVDWEMQQKMEREIEE
jgi:hypothetical protein